MNRAVLTGATGAIGLALIRECIKNKIELLVLTHIGSKRNSLLSQSDLVVIRECNLEDLESVNIDKTYDVFFHMGWENGYLRNDIYAQKKNIEYTINAVKLAKKLGCKKFIGTGSQAEYGLANTPLSSKTPTVPVSAFGATKLYVGYISRYFAKDLGLEHVWVRILSVYGPGDGEKTMIMTLIRSILESMPVKLTKCEQLWDFLYCDDAAKALLLIAEKGGDQKTYTLGSGKASPLLEYVEMVQEEIGKDAILEIGAIPYGAQQVMNLCADITELELDTGFRPSVSFREGIRKTIGWCKEDH